MKLSYCCLFFASIFCSLAEEIQLSDLDKKVIAVFDEHGHDWEPVGYPKDHSYWKELQWYRDQGDKVRPGLMYLLTVTYEGDFSKMTSVIVGLETSPGDPSDVLHYVRIHIPGMPETEQAYGKSGYIQSCLHVLSKFGEPEDMKLINLFLDYHDVTVRSTAMTQANNLQKRIDSGAFREAPSRPARRPAAVGEIELKSLGSDSAQDHKGQSGNSSAAKWPRRWVFFIITGFVVAVIACWLKFRRGLEKCPPRP